MPALTGDAWATRKARKVEPTAGARKATKAKKVIPVATEKDPFNFSRSFRLGRGKPVSVQSREDLLASVTSEDAIDSAKRRVSADMSAYLACPADDEKGKKKILSTKIRVVYRPCSNQGNLLIHSAAVAGTAAEIATVPQWYADNRVSSALANASGCTPLQLAVVRGDVEVVKTFLADPTAGKAAEKADANNWGLLHYAARFCRGRKESRRIGPPTTATSWKRCWS